MTYVDYINPKYQNDKSLKKVIFLDRDGTIHVDKVNTVEEKDLEYFPDTFSSLKRLSDLGFSFVIISNQDGIRKGKYDANKMHAFNQVIVKDFIKHGIELLAIYYSPYLPEDNDYSFKPNPGMIEQAQKDFSIDLKRSYVIGDQMSDYKAGLALGIESFIVKTGIYHRPLENDKLFDSKRAFDNLDECSQYIYKLETDK